MERLQDRICGLQGLGCGIEFRRKEVRAVGGGGWVGLRPCFDLLFCVYVEEVCLIM